MPNTYTQLYIHIVFAVRFRRALLNTSWDHRLRGYISVIVQNHGHKMIVINNVSDHLHMLIGVNPTESLSQLMKQVKGESSEWINREKLTQQKFRWQEGYGAFTYSRSHLPGVIAYIENQQQHHQHRGFQDEFKDILNKFDIDFDEHYLFREPE
jgi:putative transposase